VKNRPVHSTIQKVNAHCGRNSNSIHPGWACEPFTSFRFIIYFYLKLICPPANLTFRITDMVYRSVSAATAVLSPRPHVLCLTPRGLLRAILFAEVISCGLSSLPLRVNGDSRASACTLNPESTRITAAGTLKQGLPIFKQLALTWCTK